MAGAIGIVYLYVVPHARGAARRRRSSRRWPRTPALSSPRCAAIVGPDASRRRAHRGGAPGRGPLERRGDRASCAAHARPGLPAGRRLHAGGVDRRRRARGGASAAAQTGRRVTDTSRHRGRPPGARGRAADPRASEVHGVAVFADALTDVQSNVALIRRRILVAGVDRAGHRRARRLPRRPRAHRTHQAARAGGAQGRGRGLLQPDPRRVRRRARPARAGLRRHAAPARPARHRAQAVHRLGLARAAHADLLAQRLPRAARGRGPRRGDARAVPRPAARPGGADAQARHGAARPLAAGVRRARAAPGADGDRPAGARGRRRVHAGRRAARRPRWRCAPAPTRSRSSAIPSA